MAIVTRTVAPTPIAPGARRLFTAQAIPDGLRGFRVDFTTGNPNSWSQVAGQGRIARWGVEIRQGAGAFEEWWNTVNIPFGALDRNGGICTEIDTTEVFAAAQAMQVRVYIETEGSTVRLGVTIRASDVRGEIQ